MALTTARKKANAKYEAKAYDKTLIRLPKGRLDEIRLHIEPLGESLNGFITRAINEAMERDNHLNISEIAQQALATSQGVGVVSVPSDVLRTAQEAAERAGERVEEFVVRAVTTQAERDRLLNGMKSYKQAGNNT